MSDAAASGDCIVSVWFTLVFMGCVGLALATALCIAQAREAREVIVKYR